MTPSEEKLLSQLEKQLGGASEPGSSQLSIKPYKFRMSEVEGFRYRVKASGQLVDVLVRIYLVRMMQDAMRALTKASSEKQHGVQVLWCSCSLIFPPRLCVQLKKPG